MKFSTWWVGAALWFSLVSVASAQTAQQRVVILPFEGPANNAARRHVVTVLRNEPRVDLVDPADALRVAGGSFESPQAYVEAGRELQVAAFVEGEVVRERGRFVATLQVRDASTGRVVKTEPYPRKNPAQFKTIRGNFWRIFGDAILAARIPAAPPPPEPKVEPKVVELVPKEPPKPQKRETSPPPKPAPTRERAALTVDLLPGMMWRTFDYNDADTNLRDYESNGPAFIVGGKVEWYPGAHVTTSRWGDLGVKVDADGAIGLESNDGTGPIQTVAWDMTGSAVFRIPVDPFVPQIEVGYTKQVFKVDVDPDAVFLPKVNYNALRFGFGCALELAEMIELDVALAYLYVLDAGNIQSDRYFPDGTAGGIDLESSIAYYFLPWMGAVMGVDWRRYGHDFRADPSFMQVGGQKLAGGAVDRYIKLHFGVRFRLEGTN